MNPVHEGTGVVPTVAAAGHPVVVIASFPVLAMLLLGCSRRLVVDEVAGRMSLPSPRIADLSMDRPGAISVGGQIGIRKPAEVSWKLPVPDSQLTGNESWRLPGWSTGGHVAWTPFEGLTFSPEGFLGGEGSSLSGSGALTMGMHAEAGWIGWQVEGRIGLAWTRSRVRWRTRIESLSGDSIRLSEPQEEVRSGMAPWGQCGIQLQTAIPRQPYQVWVVGRWGMRDPYLLLDEQNAEILPSTVMDFQTGAGLHRRIGGAFTLTAGVLRSMVVPARMESSDATTEFVVQVDVALKDGWTRTR